MTSSSPPSPLARRRRTLGRAFLLSGLLLAVVAASVGGGAHPAALRVAPAANIGNPGGSQGIVNLSVNLTDAPSFSPNALTAKAGTVIDLKLTNTGSYNHTFTVANVSGYVFPATETPAQLTAWFAANGSLANVAVAGGQSTSVNLSIPAADDGDSFEVVSLIPYQFQAGMHGFLNISSGGATGPGVQATESTNDQLRFLPNQLTINATAFPVNVDIQVTNQGSTPHTFTLEAQSNNTLSPANFTQYFTAHPPMADVSLNTAGAVVWANFTVAKPGVFEYICRIPGHFSNGMFGWLYVGVTPAPTAAGPSTEIVQEGVLIGAGSLLGLGAAFTLGASLTGRFPRAPRPPAAH